MKDKIIKAGVRNLKEFGYNLADENNILTDEIYSEFFKSMLKDNLGMGVDSVINSLLKEIENKKVQNDESNK